MSTNTNNDRSVRTSARNPRDPRRLARLVSATRKRRIRLVLSLLAGVFLLESLSMELGIRALSAQQNSLRLLVRIKRSTTTRTYCILTSYLAGRRAERLSKEKNKAVNTKPAPLIVFKNDTFADLLSGKPNYIGATRIDTDLRKSNLKTLRGLPKDKHYFDDATRYKSVSEETVLVQVQKNRGRVFAKPSHTFVVLAHGQMIKPVEGEFFLALRHKPNKVMKA